MNIKRTTATAVYLAVTLALTACGGSDGTITETTAGFTIDSGLAQKGPLVRGSVITINALNTASLAPSGSSYTFETYNDLGAFNPAGVVIPGAMIETTALGYYFNESTGTTSKDMTVLRALSSLGIDRTVNVNVLTDIANLRTRTLATVKIKPPAFAAARAQAQKEVLAAFYIYNSADLMPGTTGAASFSELDLSKARAADQILAAISAQVTQLGQDGSGIATLLNQFEADIADDGAINNSLGFSISVRDRLNAAASTVNFGEVATNLNAFYKTTTYKATDLAQWMDSSGSVDRVIDKYKFTATGVVGTESQSPAYTAGSDDIGQCMSVSAGKLYRNGSAVTTGTVKVAEGDVYKIGLTNTNGELISEFMHRVPPGPTGACPTVIPSTGLTRILKFSLKGQRTVLISIAASDKVVNALWSVAELSSGNYLVAGINPAGDKTYAASIDKVNLTPIWSFFNNSGGAEIWFNSISAGKDGSAYWNGAKNTSLARADSGFVTRIDAAGTVAWRVDRAGADYSYSTATQDGGVIVAGTNNNGQFRGITNANEITKYNSAGTKVWSTALPLGESLGVFYTGIFSTTDGNTYATGLGVFDGIKPRKAWRFQA